MNDRTTILTMTNSNGKKVTLDDFDLLMENNLTSATSEDPMHTVSSVNQLGRNKLNNKKEPTEIDKAIMELEENFVLRVSHEERIRTLLKNDESLLDELEHLVISSSLTLSDGNQMKAGSLRAYEMGDKIVIEEQEDEEWKVVRTIGIKIAQLLAHARALQRVKEIENIIEGLGKDRMDQIDGIDPLDDFNNPFDDEGRKPITPLPHPDTVPPKTNPWEYHWVGNTQYYSENTDNTAKIRDLEE